MTHPPRDDGVIKYQVIHQNSGPPEHQLLDRLNKVRTKLFDLGLVGIYPDGIGYGNVSLRHKAGCIISGTATGSERVLSTKDYCHVRSFDLQKNLVWTEGSINASSESMTHCAIYQANPLVQCVLHIHNRQLWDKLFDEGHDSTSANTSYGTPEMALGMASLVAAKMMPSGLLVMAGHEEGILSYGQTISLAFDHIQAALAN